MVEEKMENEKENKPLTEDYRFIDYRLDQLELNLRKGQERLEHEYRETYQQILQTLQTMQDGQNEQNKSLIELSQRQQAIEEKIGCIDELKKAATRNTSRIKNIERRIDIYKQVLFLVGGASVTAFITALFTLLGG